MHTDEAVQAYLLGELLAGNGYRYSPKDLHGPAPLLVGLPVARGCGAGNLAQLDEAMVRLGPALTGSVAALMFLLLARRIGTPTAAIAALIWSVSSLPVYYSRYFIHETLLVTATLGLIGCGARALRTGSVGWGIAAGLSGGVMLGCKETALISFAAMGIALVPWLRGAGPQPDRRLAAWAAGIVFCAVVVALYSWGGQNWRGPLDLIGSYVRFAGRAAGEGHEKPAWYYALMLWKTPASLAVVLLALGEGIATFRRPLAMGRFFALYGLVLFAVYSLIPYKTPWLALNFWLPICVLAGGGIVALWQTTASWVVRGVVIAGAALLLGLLGQETWKHAFVDPIGERNPYAYSHTGEDFLRLPGRVDQLAFRGGRGTELRIAVIAQDAWPLPWYLRHYPNTGYWQPGQPPGEADLYLTSTETWEGLGKQLHGWRPEYFGVRPEVLMILWTPPERTPAK